MGGGRSIGRMIAMTNVDQSRITLFRELGVIYEYPRLRNPY